MKYNFNYEGSYKCVCGREFNNSQAFNGHKANCKEHHMKKYGNLNKFQQSINIAQAKSSKISKVNAELRKKKKLANWISEQHTCEKCGKIMTEYYGSGRFCSSNCARSFFNIKK